MMALVTIEPGQGARCPGVVWIQRDGAFQGVANLVDWTTPENLVMDQERSQLEPGFSIIGAGPEHGVVEAFCPGWLAPAPRIKGQDQVAIARGKPVHVSDGV